MVKSWKIYIDGNKLYRCYGSSVRSQRLALKRCDILAEDKSKYVELYLCIDNQRFLFRTWN